MKEHDLRKFHRYLGVVLALFFLLQGGSGLLIAAGALFATNGYSEDRAPPHGDEFENDHGHASETAEAGGRDGKKHGILGLIHHREGMIWHLYRVLGGIGLLGQLFSGLVIFVKFETRRRKAARK